MGVPVRPQSSGAVLCTKELFLLHHFFEQAARRWPERTALDVPPGQGRPARRTFTYAELDTQTNALACLLQTFVTEECVVAILLPRGGEHLYVSQLAALKAGAAYVCIDPSFPDEQTREILKDSEAVALLTDTAGLSRAQDLRIDAGRTFDVAELIVAELVRGSVNLFTAPSQSERPAQNSLAYIIYTSGTTGTPKGIMIEHAGIVNLIASDIEEFNLSPDDRVAQGSSPAYDSSVEEIWLAFSAGATVVVMDEETARLGPDLVSWIERERITVLCPPPTLLRAMGCDDPQTALPELSLLYVGGEALPEDLADLWARGRSLVNGYGPTECSVTSLRARIREGEAITIGRPVAGLRTRVLDESLEEVADGEWGELCLGGVGLARGYRNRPDLTARKFPTHPLYGRIYRTGDLVHRAADGRFFYHGRIDSQVKVRGYRIELEAIESRLAECEGVRAAACRVQDEAGQQTLVAFVVPEDGCNSLSFDALKTSVRKVLPAYMVPGRFAFLTELPTTIGGKLNRRALPIVETHEREANHSVAPRDEVEKIIAAAFRQVFRLRDGASIDDDFFNDLGGDSLSAARLISLLRDESVTASLAVRDLYAARTIAALAERVRGGEAKEVEPGNRKEAERGERREAGRGQGRPVPATFVQAAWLLAGVILGSSIAYFAVFDVIPRLIRDLGLIPFLLLAPILFITGLVIYVPVSVTALALIKRALVGRYRPLRAPVWGSFYVRNWMVQQAAHIVPWSLLEGTVFQQAALCALGARIGRRVHIHRGVNLLDGGWDLLEIGDDVTVGQDASIRLVDLEDGELIVGSISLGRASTLDVRVDIGPNTVLEEGAYLTALSALAEGSRIPRDELWDGIPAKHAGQSPPRPALSEQERILTPFGHGIALVASRFAVGMLLGLPLELPILALALFYGIDTESALNWYLSPSLHPSMLLALMLLATLPVPLMLAFQALVMRALGRVREGTFSRWGWTYIRVWIKTRMVHSAGEWLSGTLFWPAWLRLAGMRVGRGCEISTIIDVVPELTEIGGESFFADGIYLGGPRVHRGTVTLAQTRLGENTFLGNHAVIPAGHQLPRDILIGVCTVGHDSIVRAGTSWFGHPPFELPRREVIECDRRLTHEPSPVRYLNRVFWELLRFALPIPFVLVPLVWYRLLAAAEATTAKPVFLLVVPLMSLGVGVFFCLLVLMLKWVLLGRVRPGTHPLWSCWCSRWDFLYVAWGFYARAALSALEGSLLLSWYLRAMGMRVGRRVVLGKGFAQVVDPDMLSFDDGATVSCQFQAHTFEDRVLKIDHVKIRHNATVGSGAVLLYGADIGARTTVTPHSVVMKRESLLADHSYAGCPTRPIQRSEGIGTERSEGIGIESLQAAFVSSSIETFASSSGEG
jgi:non-ribosomal peptide synthetase-like protein